MIFGYTDCPDAVPKRLWTTHGAPYLLECWFKPYNREPVALDVDMIIRVTLGK